jgi:hypothetical protein
LAPRASWSPLVFSKVLLSMTTRHHLGLSLFDTSLAPKIDSCKYTPDLQRVISIPSVILRPLRVDRFCAHDLSVNSLKGALLSRIRDGVLHPQRLQSRYPEPPSGSLCYLPKTSWLVLISYGRSLTRGAQMGWDGSITHTQIC